EELNRQYEEWMKIAADNKINASNTWNFALIDYFHNMTLLRDGDSINFQKASCTLDGCMKIYTSRVDSVATETGKLLSGLAESNGVCASLVLQRSSRSENTLVKDFNAITLKKFDLEFSVDPLFKKTSADFDEGGARGLLLNHLGTHAGLKIIFDASDVTAYNGDADEEQAVSSTEEDGSGQAAETTASGGSVEVSEDDEVKDEKDKADEEQFDAMDEDTEEAGFGGAGDLDDDVDDDRDDEDDEDGDGGEARKQRAATEGEQEGEGYGILPNFSEADFLASMANNTNQLFSYFDTALNKNWAGPQHWKLLRPAKPSAATAEKSTAATRQRKEKEVLEVNFVDGAEVDLDTLFAPATASINMPKTHDRAEEQNMLPDDLHYSARRLLSLFVKPALMVCFHARVSVASVMRLLCSLLTGGVLSGGLNDDFGEPIFNAPPGFDEVDDDDDDDDIVGGGFDDAGFEEDVDADDMPIVFEAEDTDYGDALASATRTVKPAYVSYARTAKRVDVKRLKDNIWRKLTNEAQEESAVGSPQKPRVDACAEGEQRFTEIIGGLKRVYPKETMKDISVSFCFICLLHLANEKNLKITGDASLAELKV
ncbi:condensin complex subunit 2/barren, partial [Thamnocephalis sphaerospora]